MGATAATGVRTPAFRLFGYIKVLALGLLVAKAKKGKGGKIMMSQDETVWYDVVYPGGLQLEQEVAWLLILQQHSL